MKTISKKLTPNTLLYSQREMEHKAITKIIDRIEKETPIERPQSEKDKGWAIYTDLDGKLNSFRNLKENWDSYNANKIGEIAIIKASDILEDFYSDSFLIKKLTINIFPMRDGGIQFEFDEENICAELEISPTGSLTFLSFNDEGEIKQTKVLSLTSELFTLLEDIRYA